MPALSIVMPFFRKLVELRAVLPINARYLGRRDVEVILVLDEPSQEADVLALLDQFPLIRARVIVNDRDHEWRAPSAAINVGIRAARGEYVLVVSPESLFVENVPQRVLRKLQASPDKVILGRVGFATFEQVHGRDPSRVFEAARRLMLHPGYAQGYYGSIAVSKTLLEAVGGWDESVSRWGGDDDNVRIRLSMHGADLVLDYGLKLLHLSPGAARPYGKPEDRSLKAGLEERRAICLPLRPRANPDEWGMEFDRVARDWAEPALPRPRLAASGPLAGSVEGPLSYGRTTRGGGARPRVVAAFSFRYDAHLVPDLLANLDPIVDAWVAWDDRGAKGLFTDERERRRALIQAAHAIGGLWVLAVDPDERFEARLTDGIDELTRGDRIRAWSFQVRELYAGDRYRSDGVWDRKHVPRLFPLRGDLRLANEALHGPAASGFKVERSGFNLYHLKMIAPERRRARSALYRHLDPDNQYQSIGYDYLADDEGAVLEAIPAGRGYQPAHEDDGGLWMPEPPSTASAPPPELGRRHAG